jgi:hypothetical protein
MIYFYTRYRDFLCIDFVQNSCFKTQSEKINYFLFFLIQRGYTKLIDHKLNEIETYY